MIVYGTGCGKLPITIDYSSLQVSGGPPPPSPCPVSDTTPYDKYQILAYKHPENNEVPVCPHKTHIGLSQEMRSDTDE